jgi:hypothetical protein
MRTPPSIFVFYILRGPKKSNSKITSFRQSCASTTKQETNGTSASATPMHSIAIVLLLIYSNNVTRIQTQNLCGLHIFVHTAFTEVHLNTARRAAAAFCYKCSVVSSHVLDYFVDHLNLRKQTLACVIYVGEKNCLSVDENRDANKWEVCVVRTKGAQR